MTQQGSTPSSTATAAATQASIAVQWPQWHSSTVRCCCFHLQSVCLSVSTHLNSLIQTTTTSSHLPNISSSYPLTTQYDPTRLLLCLLHSSRSLSPFLLVASTFLSLLLTFFSNQAIDVVPLSTPFLSGTWELSPNCYQPPAITSSA